MSTTEPVPPIRFEHLDSPEMRSENILTFRPQNPEMFADLKETANTVTNLYLNYADEPYRLRIEGVTQSDGQTSHRAILEGMTKAGELQVVETEISEEAFAHYASQSQYPRLTKKQHPVSPGVTIDWYDNGESFLKVDSFINPPDEFSIPMDLYEFVDSPLFDNEFRAQHSAPSDERLTTPRELNAAEIVFEINEHQRQLKEAVSPHPYTFVTLAGRSGSGKSYLRDEVVRSLEGCSIAELSTDDYHRGLTYLTKHNLEVNGTTTPWDDWDTRIVYDVDLAREEIAKLLRGEAVSKRSYNFSKQEPAEITENIQPASVIIIDGIHAGDPVFDDIAHFRFEVPTGVATSIWRRLERDFTTGRAVGDNVNSPDKVLRYMLERAEPAYQAQKM